MVGWYTSLSIIEQGFALVAIAASTLLIMQTGLQLYGFGMQAFSEGEAGDFSADSSEMSDVEGDVAADFDSDFEGDLSADFEAEAPDLDMATDAGLDLSDINMEIDSDLVLDSATAIEMSVNLPADDASEPALGHSTEHTAANSSESVAPSHPLRLFTMRGMVAFFALGGWSGLIALQNKWSLLRSVALASLIGAIGSYLIAKTMQFVMTLQDQGNVDLANAIGIEATVYIRIPAHGNGKGKVTLTLQERFVELDAVTHSDLDLTAGSKVRVVGQHDEDTLVVRPL